MTDAVVVTVPGFYAGRFRKAGQSYPADAATVESVDLDALTKEELLAVAIDRGVAVKPADTKADLLAALKAAA